MFGKSKNNSATAINKDINESIKTLSYLARAEKYFDLELKKNGQTSKPLLKIVDIIEPLRQIGDTLQKLAKGQKFDDAALKRIFAAENISQIIEVSTDILSLNPKGLVSSDKTALAKLNERLTQAAKAAGVPYPSAKTEEVLMPKAKKSAAQNAPANIGEEKAAEATEHPGNDAERNAANNFVIEPVEAAANQSQPEEDPFDPNEELFEEPRTDRESQAGDWPNLEVKRSFGFQNNQAGTQSFKKLGDTPEQAPSANQNQQPETQGSHAQNENSYFAVEPQPQPQNWQTQQQSQPQSQQPQPQAQSQSQSQNQQQTQSQKVVPLKQNRKEAAASYNLPQKYFATSYAGMNLQEAAEIIAELANDPSNLEIVMLEHASRVKPVSEGKEIIGDLLAIAPIADSFETGTEITDKNHLSVLKNADRIISICKDIATVKIEGFDRRKQKLFENFIPEDIRHTVELARIAYPEVFAADGAGETVSDILLDMSDILNAHADESGDRLFTELLSQVVSQIVLYAEHNDLRLKFDIVSKKNRLNSNPQPLTSRSEVAVLRALTFVPKIARQGHEVLNSDRLAQHERDTVNKALEILQLSYVHARDNYSAEINSFYDNKAA